MKKIVIIGASGHGGMILECLEKEGKYDMLGFLDSYKPKGSIYNDFEILGSEEDIPNLVESENLYGGIIAIGNNWTRKKMVDKIRSIKPDFKFISVIHPSAIISKNIPIGVGTIIMPGVIINANSVVGDFCIINTNSSLGHDGIMGDYSSISSGVAAGGNLRLGDFSAISLGANIIENITIGEHSIVGAGALVVKDIPEKVVVYGSPAKLVRYRNFQDPYLTGDASLPKLDEMISNS